MLKRSVDLILAIVALLLASPLLVLLAILIRADSPGPVFFRQQRIGLHGKTFGIFKFRTMVANASSIGPYYTASDDPRITRIGRVLRKTSLDELPQLINVITGDMSLVGPRPNVPAQRELYSEEDWNKRHLVRPGITGLAQVSGRSALSQRQRDALDHHYVTHQSTKLDISILIRTVALVVSRKQSN